MNNDKNIFLLHIDTATEHALISVSKNGNVINFITSSDQKNHASFLQPAVKQILSDSVISVNQLSAVSVTAGPGSYTGLRVGLASAKGLCYALKIPLITLGTLEVMAKSVIESTIACEKYYYCPMIDARRMEVFTAVFDHTLKVITAPCAAIIDPLFQEQLPDKMNTIFSGNGAKKFMALFKNQHFIYSNTGISASAMANISSQKFAEKSFTPIMSAEPLYIKQFFTIL